MSPRHIAAALITVMLWGLNHVAAKVGVGISSPFWFVGVRLVLVGIMLAPFVPAPRGHWRPIALLSLTYGTLHLGLINFGLAGIDAATSVIIVQLGAPFTILMGRFAFGESFGLWRWAGVALAFVGIAFLAGEPGNASPIYFIASIVAMAVWGLSNFQIKRMDALHPLTISTWSSLLAAPQLLLISAITESGQMDVFGPGSSTFWLMVPFSAIGSSIIAHSLWNGLLHRYPMATVAPFNLLVPVVGFAAAIAFLGEPITDEKILGGLLTFAGVAIIQIRMLILHVAAKDTARDAARTPAP
jgi:O-acetylserine/cysteine efflux transporter